MIVVTPMFPIVSIITMLPPFPIVPLQAIIPTLAVAVVPSMLWAIVGVITTVVDIVTPEHAPWIVGDLVSDCRMVSQKLSHFFMFIEIVAVVNQPGICLQIRSNTRMSPHKGMELSHFTGH